VVTTLLSLGLVPVLFVVPDRLRERVLLYRGKSLLLDKEAEKADARNLPPSSEG
jgi:hypothetical protein